MIVVEVKTENMICGSQLDVYLEDRPDVLRDWEVEQSGW